MLHGYTYIRAVLHEAKQGFFPVWMLLLGPTAFALGIFMTNQQIVLTGVACTLMGYARRLPDEQRNWRDRLAGLAMGMMLMIFMYDVLG
jgi:hypothetical protein